jgi:cytochrome c oxidase subunit 3
VWVGIAAISMSFAAFTSAMIVRQGASPDWRHFQLPRILYLNTLILLASSFTLRMARTRLASIRAVLSEAPDTAAKLYSDGIHWLYVTAALGALFVGGQLLAWRNLAAQGLFLATNPSSSFFYVFTALHALLGLHYSQVRPDQRHRTDYRDECCLHLLAFHGRTLGVPVLLAGDADVIVLQEAL